MSAGASSSMSISSLGLDQSKMLSAETVPTTGLPAMRTVSRIPSFCVKRRVDSITAFGSAGVSWKMATGPLAGM